MIKANQDEIDKQADAVKKILISKMDEHEKDLCTPNDT